ncbi:MAG: hypothetical protein IJU56_05360 [Clostridia bacterium]|nr:hypothetical protein [Clostridia bacterium]
MKRVLCLILCAAMLLPGVSIAGAGAAAETRTAAAQPQPAKGERPYPFLLIRGMLFNGLTYKAGTDEERNAFGGIQVPAMLQAIGKAIGGALLKRDMNVFTDTLVDYARDLMGLMACDKNGEPKYDTTVKTYDHALSCYPELLAEIDGYDEREYGILKRAVEEYGAENVYYYNYDWRLDPFVHAQKIAALIDTALRETGKTKIDLACASMGGILTIAYLTKYGADKLHRVLFLSSTFCGTYVTGDVLRGEVRFTGETVYNFLSAMTAENRSVAVLLRSLHTMGVFRLIDALASFLVPRIKDRVYDTFMRDTFATMPVIWALVQPSVYDACVAYMFGGKEAEYARIIELSKQYQEMIAARNKMLRKMAKKGLEICVVANYDLPVVPAYAHSDASGDTVLESRWMLGGATVAPFGKTLPDSYRPANPVRLSADRMVDLSKVLFPESTWAIKGAPHVACDYGSDYNEFVFWLLRKATQPTVDDSAQYPQFMRSSNRQELIPLK